MSKSMDNLFIFSSIIFNISVSIVYLASKLANLALLQVAGVVVIFLILPFTITMFGFIKEKEGKKIIISNIIILFYLFLELLLDYILLIPFRDILAIHIPYIIVIYAALFSMIGVSFDKNRKMGFVVLLTFFILIGCLIYMFIG
ncbi:MAG: hypothetical protein HWN65_06605 [Candidatus Helarchaeota archaeon]|nr:hypothetical protein [Candidatus Helarchaeota archaeon]